MSRDGGSLLGGRWGQWVVDGGCPRWLGAHRIEGAGGGGDRGTGLGETAEEPGEWVAGVLVVLMRAKDKALGFCSELSTVAARWWPAVVFWAHGAGMGAPMRGVEAGGEL
jgi:hypothetical protein